MEYDPTSCGPLTSLSPNIDGQEYTFEIVAPAVQPNGCELDAIDQTGKMYFHNFSVLNECPTKEFLFAADDEVFILEGDEPEPLEPTGFSVRI